MYSVSVLFVSFLSCVLGSHIASLQLENMVIGLQQEVKELQKGRQQDNEAIRRLQEKVRYFVRTKHDESSVEHEPEAFFGVEEHLRNAKVMNRDRATDGRNSELKHLNDELQSLRSELLITADVDDNHGSDLRTEVDFLRKELLRLRKQMEEGDVRNKEEVRTSSGRVAVHWLQKTVEDLRHEMKEMAISLNTTAALAEKERTHTSLELLRSDIEALEHRMDSVRLDREKNAAVIVEMKEDVEDLRKRLQASSADQSKLMSEINSLKEEYEEQKLISQKKNLMVEEHQTDTSDEAWLKEIRANNHPKLRHGHWKVEVEHLRQLVAGLERRQIDLTIQMEHIKKNQADSTVKIDSMEKICHMVINKSGPLEFEHKVTNQRVELLEDMVNRTERQTLDIQSRVNNITSSGIQKLHGSTMQLFEALERLEGNYDKTIADIRREMLKLDYNFSQAQSDFEEIRDRQVASEQLASSLRNDVGLLQSETRRNHLRILLVQSAALNRTLMNNQQNGLSVQDSKLSNLESKIQSLASSVDVEKSEIEALHRQIIEKVDEQELSKWEKVQRKVRESILEFREDLPKMKDHQEKIESEFDKFVQLLPEDCSRNSALEHTSQKRSGAYLIRHPRVHTSTIKVYCDMDTSGGKWTVIQRRSKGDQNFTQDWNHYKNGFGDVISGDFWLGNDILHYLTTSDDYSLRIDLWDSTGRYKYAEYRTFRVLQESDNYRLVVGGYQGNASDAMEYHNGMSFSTPDRDNDASAATHCGKLYGSGWWYKHCQYVNINGRYNSGITWYDIDGKEWSELTKVEMKIKLRNLTF